MQELIRLSPSIAYQKQPDGNIIAYIGCSTEKKAIDWLDELLLRGWEGVVQQASVITGKNIAYEVKLWRLTEEQIQNFAKWHHSPFESPTSIRASAPKPKTQWNPRPSM